MWAHADRYLEPYLATGGDYQGVRAPFTSPSSPTCSASRRRTARVRRAHGSQQRRVGNTNEKSPGHSLLENSYQKFSAHIEDRRDPARGDAFLEMAAAKFPDGSTRR